ncbi:TPA: XRE family transcriptional regulator [Pseudomonas aeruginosa]
MRDLPNISSTPTVACQLTQNLNAILKVAGPVRLDGKVSPLRTAEIHRRSSIARSTIRALKSPTPGSAPNPDLRTLTGLAKALDLPVPFLLMGATEWTTIIQAINGIRDPITAAEELVGIDGYAPANLLEKILAKCGIHPDRPPYGGAENKSELARLVARNEWRQRNCSVFNALIDNNVSDRTTKVLLAAFAASYVNTITPYNPVEATGS